MILSFKGHYFFLKIYCQFIQAINSKKPIVCLNKSNGMVPLKSTLGHNAFFLISFLLIIIFICYKVSLPLKTALRGE
ncbi:hypothetical protein Ldro_1617 [Legionella drozanskii LLAP-1]|uniref:Uncharacterized protein n=1 Tax=Legionella drozanskii LLAP-1 TaxID=1212489 RepID=A0A0W0SXB0_9GAMM|nr:hypothetical protein Ldro_1617 [Legionella drozanskii LLAP-1]